MSGTASTLWYFGDWLSASDLHSCSLAAKGLWIELLAIAGQNKGRDHGFVLIGGEIPTTEEIARLVAATPEEIKPLLEELERRHVFSRDRHGAIYNRRMVRAEKNRKNGKLGGNPKLLKNKETANSVKLVSETPNGKGNGIGKESLFREEGFSELGPAPEPGERFDEFWAAYPKRDGANPKHPAKLKFEGAVRAGADPAAIIAGARAYASAESTKVGTPYVAQAVVWLNQRRWEDYAAAALPAPTGPPQPPRAGLPTDAELRAKYANRGKTEEPTAAGADLLATSSGVHRQEQIRVD